ncbi:hypothetical protein [Texcoconibacillus texcoconensis]|uniref:DUF5105 domain-containing protein n=1 Tax=Texcoconibacillus texcoconensis TaxID=1095777 RepID=A0A840QR79_9BACI|nr:hypothetical protein [Texcoconibacillus texcoconensis]MBB5173874.1 hypothetical protein [Texcoconibacillus texcoconensis]
MKKTLTYFVLITLIFLSACNAGQSSPEDAAETFTEALLSGDMDTAEELTFMAQVASDSELSTAEGSKLVNYLQDLQTEYENAYDETIEQTGADSFDVIDSQISFPESDEDKSVVAGEVARLNEEMSLSLQTDGEVEDIAEIEVVIELLRDNTSKEQLASFLAVKYNDSWFIETGSLSIFEKVALAQ